MIIIGIAGGTGSGKSTVVRNLIDFLPPDSVAIIPQDNYYRDMGHLSLEERNQLNFDHPDSIEFELLVEHVKQIKQNKEIDIPTYSFSTHSRLEETITLHSRKVVIVEGIMVLVNEYLRDQLDLKIFVDTDADDRLGRRLKRDISERGRTVEEVLWRYHSMVKPMHLQFIEPSKRYADIIIPQGGDNKVAIDVLKDYLLKRWLNL
jgi:uridine kinase